MTEYVIGIDGGGTKTDGVCADLNAQVVTTASTGPTSLTATSLGLASMNLVETFRQLTESLPPDSKFARAVIGVAGVDTAEDQRRAEEVFREALTTFKIESIEIVNDISLILAAGSSRENAVALIAGTGSQCFGRTADNRKARTSGMDFLLADQGSGYDIGRLVLRAATCSYDGRGPKSVLEQLVLNHFEVSHFEGLKTVVYAPVLNKTQVAELAKLWITAYEQNDQAAQEILQQVIADLDVLASTVIDQLDLLEADADLVCAGSIAKLDPVFNGLKERLARKYPRLQIILLTTSPVMGAITLALQGVKKE